MFPLFCSAAVSAVTAVALLFVSLSVHTRCRNQPGGPGYPSRADWSTLNDTINGQLINVVLSAKACLEFGCTEAQWESGVFQQTIPGSMDVMSVLPEVLLISTYDLLKYNWEQVIHTPPSSWYPSTHQTLT